MSSLVSAERTGKARCVQRVEGSREVKTHPQRSRVNLQLVSPSHTSLINS